MKIHLLSGFLGSGKTTAIQQAVLLLQRQGMKTGVITNDQGTKLVDGGVFANMGVPSKEVTNGCFCCNYHELDSSISSLISLNKVSTLFAESVGSCTDIVATVLKPLNIFRPGVQVTMSVFADARLLQMMLQGPGSFHEAVHYIYLKQLEEAAIVVINKVDLLTAVQLSHLKLCMQERYSKKTLLYQNSLRADNIQRWMLVLNEHASVPAIPSLQIDYDRYAAGESQLGWLDQVLDIYSADNMALKRAEHIINSIYEKVNECGFPIGHLKFLVNNAIKVSFTSAAESPVTLAAEPGCTASLLINMRIQADPATLEQLVASVVKETQHCNVVVLKQSAFQPGYPKPVYRM